MEPYHDESDMSRASIDSGSSLSSTSAVLDRIHEVDGTNGDAIELKQTTPLIKDNKLDNKVEADEEEAIFKPREELYPSTTTRRIVWTVCGLCLAGWLVALFLFLGAGAYNSTSEKPHDSQITISKGSGKAITFTSVLSGAWYPRSRSISWVTGPNGEDGMMLERDVAGKDYLVVEDIRSFDRQTESHTPHTLMRDGAFMVGGDIINPSDVFPSPDLKKVLVMSDKENNWRHSSTGRFWIFDVETQKGEPLDPANPQSRVQLATWAPNSDSIVFTRDNNMYLRQIAEQHVIQITEDGGADLFYGVPDWVYEEEVFSSNSATWWSEDGDYVAFLRTNESQVKEYPIQYVLQRPSGKDPPEGLENYPETRRIKYPKAGSPNPIVELKFYDVKEREVFDIIVDGDYSDDDRLITEVVWAGRSGKILIKETNRVSDTLMVVLIDVQRRSGKPVRSLDIKAFDNGWFEITESTTFVPSDPANGRPHDGYIDTVIRDGYNHLAYFSPLDSSDPLYLTGGEWEVVDGPSAIDIGKNVVYFVAAKRAPGQRHIYSVRMDGSDFKPVITDDSKDGYYDASFSKGTGYVLLSHKGPDIPTQKVMSTPSLGGLKFETIVEDNLNLRKLVSQYELPTEIYSTIEVGGFELPVLERRPPHFDEKKKYPVVFQQYQGPGSQSVDRRFGVDFQSYLASNLGYVVVTVDGRGTGFKGRKYRCITRGNIGAWEAHDQIAAAKIWADKKYVDAERIAIWGWSYGGFMTLKVLETDAGQTFKYGVAVAPVTDWRFYDSIYTERYMFTPQDNPVGYENSSISNATALGSNVRFLVMHGSADDNVHYQNSLILLDRLDIQNIENYDFHTFPDSDHSIYFHNANPMVFGRLRDWLINAFNGEWLKVDHPKPLANVDLGTSFRKS